MPTLADYVEQALEKIGKAATTYEIYGHVGKLADLPMTTMQTAAIRTVLQRDNRFYRVSRGVWDLTKRSPGMVGPKPTRVKRVLKVKEPATPVPAPPPVPPTPVSLIEPALGGVEVYLPGEVVANAPLAVLEEMWRSYVERRGDWANLSPLHVSRLKSEIDRRKAGGEVAVKAPEIVLQAPKGDYEGPEEFQFLGLLFDVRKANELVKKTPHEPVMVPVSQLKTFLSKPVIEAGKVVGFSLGVAYDVSYAKKLTRRHLKRPLLIVRVRDGAYLPIDGYHRIAAADRLGVAELPGYVLTPKEARQVATRGQEFLYKSPETEGTIQPSVVEIIGRIPEDAEKYGVSDDPDIEAVRQFNAPDDIVLPVPIVREGPSPGSATQEPLGPGQVGKTYTTGPGAIEEVVDEVELRRKLERQKKAKARRRFQSPGWSVPTSIIPEKGTRTWFSSEDKRAPPGKWREMPGWFSSEPKPRGKWKVFPGWFSSGPKPRGKWKAFPGWCRSEAPVEPEYGRKMEQEARVAWLEDRIMGWKENLRKGEVTEADFRNVTTYLYDQLELIDPYNQLVAERYAEPVRRKELSDGLAFGVALTAGLGIIGALLWKSNRGGAR